jgi:hypothetical protein
MTMQPLVVSFGHPILWLIDAAPVGSHLACLSAPSVSKRETITDMILTCSLAKLVELATVAILLL